MLSHWEKPEHVYRLWEKMEPEKIDARSQKRIESGASPEKFWKAF